MSNSPITVFGISLKGLIITALLGGILLMVIDLKEARRSIYNYFQDNTQTTNKPVPTPQEPRNIIATPEMIAESIKEIQSFKAEEVESPKEDLTANTFRYIVELKSGGALNAVALTINPESVVITSSSGIETVIHKNSIEKVHRIKIQPKETQGASN